MSVGCAGATHNAEHLFPGDCLIYIIWVDDGGTGGSWSRFWYVGHPVCLSGCASGGCVGCGQEAVELNIVT